MIRGGEGGHHQGDDDDDDLDPRSTVHMRAGGLDEELADRAVFVDPPDRLGQQGRDREDLEPRVLLVRRQRDGIGDHDLVEGSGHQLLDRVPGQDAVGREHADRPR